MSVMTHSFSNITTMYNYFLYELDDPDTRKWFMVRSPLPVATVIIAYLLFVTRIGPNFMAKRSPYSLHKVIIVTNVFQIIANIWLSKQYGSVAWKDSSAVCRGVSEVEKSQTEVLTAHTSWLYYMLKIVDLWDTVIFVLRKKDKQLSFLHLYHHAGTLAISWLVVKYYPGGATILLQLTNCLVHILMFTYYSLAAIGPKMAPYLWWKKYLTTIQIAQFFLMLGINAYLWLFKCAYPKLLMYVYVPYIISILILFLIFFKRAYSQKNKQDNKTE